MRIKSFITKFNRDTTFNLMRQRGIKNIRKTMVLNIKKKDYEVIDNPEGHTSKVRLFHRIYNIENK